MFTYRPNFCAECGERIIGEPRHLWSSRRFCGLCSKRFRKSRIVAPVVTALALVGIGLGVDRAVRRPAPPLVIQQGQLSPISSPADLQARKAPPLLKGDGSKPASDSSVTVDSSPTSYGPNGTATERPTDPNEVVSICGARTKKGTPYTRRVRGTGRCWQHKGMPRHAAGLETHCPGIEATVTARTCHPPVTL
jgi:hypothetical protein